MLKSRTQKMLERNNKNLHLQPVKRHLTGIIKTFSCFIPSTSMILKYYT